MTHARADAAAEAVLAGAATKNILRFSTAGSVDDGKSTLIGRLLYETKCVYTDHLAEATKNTTNASVAAAGETIDFSLLTDGLKAEREQGITIDVAYRYFETPKRKFIIADTPGHEQYTRNMATGASTANLSLILVDARKGLLAQSKRHAFISSLLGIKHTVVCVNKMDLVGYSEEVFDRIEQDFLDFAGRLEIPDLRFVPLSALKGDNVTARSAAMPWYDGPPLLSVLEDVHVEGDRNLIDFRFPVQLVARPTQDFRGFAGKVQSGVVRVGDPVLALPSRKTSTVARIVTYDGDLEQAFPPQAVTLVLEDEIDVSRGDLLVHPQNQPLVGRVFECMLVWLADAPFRPGNDYVLKSGTQQLNARAEELRYEVDVNTLRRLREREELGLNGIGRAVLSATRPLFYDPYRRNRATGGLILVDPLTNATVGAGMLIQRGPAESLPARPGAVAAGAGDASAERRLEQGAVSPAAKAAALGQDPRTVWLTGLPASGLTEVGDALDRLLMARGACGYVLDGRVVRATLSHGLSFNPADTFEHLRRVGAVAHMVNQAGLFAICCFVSPSRQVRSLARELVGAERFVEVYVASPREWCEARDSNQVYARARSGELSNVPGVNADYQRPEAPTLTVRPDQDGVEGCAQQIFSYLDAQGCLPGSPGRE
ncbi:MAG: sulfate adenylyltransferase subunit CysN [Planctomycetes bacterium]|nr:sulfate adenylyltransferase subunit CysN [Planctomycetota bacterium]